MPLMAAAAGTTPEGGLSQAKLPRNAAAFPDRLKAGLQTGSLRIARERPPGAVPRFGAPPPSREAAGGMEPRTEKTGRSGIRRSGATAKNGLHEKG